MPEWSEIVKTHGEVVWKTVYRLLGNHRMIIFSNGTMHMLLH